MMHKFLSRGLAAIAAVALSVSMSAVQAKSSSGSLLADVSQKSPSSGSVLGATKRVMFAPVTNGYNVAGIDSVDDQGSPFNFVGFAFLGANSHVTGIGWDLNIQTVGFSWLSEAVIGFTNLNQTAGVNLTAGIGNDFSGTSNFNSGGVVDLVGISLDFSVGADGNLRVEFFESFDDNFQSADAHYLRGSALFVRYEALVPEPSTYALMALGLAGIGFVARRRRA